MRPSPLPLRLFLFLPAPLLLAALLFVAACTNAPPNEEGGELRFDPTPPPITIVGDACAPTGDAGAAHAWSDLYRDYFGPTGVASCSRNAGQCHGDKNSLGAVSSNYVCDGTAAGCYQGITSQNAGLLSGSDPTQTALYLTLRKACGGGLMPKQPATFFFSAADMKRITDWIAEGAPNN